MKVEKSIHLAWANATIRKLCDEFARRKGRLGLVVELAEALLATYEYDSAMPDDEFNKHKQRLNAVIRAAECRQNTN